MKTKSFLILLGALAMGSAGHAQQILSYTGTTLLASTGAAKTIQLSGFDSSLGTLNQVTLTYTGRVVQTGLAENTGSSSSMSYTITGAAAMSLSKSSNGSAIFASPTGTFDVTANGSIVTPFDGTQDFSGLSGKTYQLQDKTWTSSASFSGADLATYLTSGYVNFTSLATSTGKLVLDSGNGAGGILTSAGATLKVDYAYSPIPEPSTYAAILGGVMLGCAMIRSDRRLAL